MPSIGSLKIALGLQTSGLIKGLRKSEFLLKRQAQKYKALGASMTQAITLPLLGIGTAGVTLAVQLEQSFGKIENLVGVTGTALDQLKSGVSSLSGSTAKSQKELADALFAVTSAGARGANALNILEQAAKASNIGLGETKSVALAVTAAVNAYGPDMLSAARATDILTSTIREGNLEAESLAPVLGRVIPLASQLGISFEEVGANIATFTRLGGSAEEAVTSLRGVMATFLKPTEQVNKVLESVGLTAQDVRDKIRKDGLADTLVLLTDTFKGNEEGLGKLIPNIRALTNVLATAGAQGETYVSIAKNIANSTGIVDKGFENVSQSSGYQFRSMLVSLQNAGIQLGTKLLPFVLKAVAVVQELVSRFTSLSGATQDTVIKYGLLAAAAGPVLSILGSTIGVISQLKGVMAQLISTVTKLVTAMTGPIGIAIAAIAAGAYLVIDNWDKVKGAIVKVTNSVIDLYNESVFVRGVIQGIVGFFEIGVIAVKTLWNNLKLVGGILKKIVNFEFDGLKGAMLKAGVDMKIAADQAAKDVKSIIKEKIENVIDPKEVLKIDGSDVDNAVAPLIDKFNTLKQKFTDIFDIGSGGGAAGNISKAAQAVAKVIPISSNATASPEVSRQSVSIDSSLPSLNSIGPLNDVMDTLQTKVSTARSLYDGFTSGVISKTAAIGGLTSAYSSLAEQYGPNNAGAQEMLNKLHEMGVAAFDVTEILNQGMGDSLVALGENLGKAVVEADSFGAGLKSVVSGIANVMLGILSQIGKLAISTGIAVKGIRIALKSLNPAAAIAGGAALIALSSAVKAKLSNSIPRAAKGAVLTGETLLIGGEYPGAANNPELVTPENMLRKIFREEGAGGGGVMSVDIDMDRLRFYLNKDRSRVA